MIDRYKGKPSSLSSSSLEDVKDNVAKNIYGMTRGEAWSRGVCIRCKQPWRDNCYSEAGRQEYRLNAMCEVCYDTMIALLKEDN